MGFENSGITYLGYVSCALFVVGVGILSYVTYRVANWMTEEEYDRWMEADIAKRDVQQREDRNLIVGKIEKIDKLKGKIKEKEEELGIETNSKRKGKNKEKSEDSDKDSNATPKTKEEKHFDAIEAVLNLPAY